MTTKRKELKDLNLLDRFLFAEAMEDPVIVQNILEIILGKEIALKYLPQTEKEQRTAPYNRFVKLDVWAWDSEDVVYDTEVQAENTKNLPKRSRLYQGMIDVKLLDPGETDFNKLNQVYIIMIMPFDLLGKGLYQYTFQMACEEAPGIRLEDGAVRIFLNTNGVRKENVNPELIELLHYIEHTTETVSRVCTSSRIKDMQKRITKIKSSEKVGLKYMQAWEEKVLGENQAREEGKKEGIKEGIIQGEVNGIIETYKEFEKSTEDIIKKLMERFRMTEKEARECIAKHEQGEE